MAETRAANPQRPDIDSAMQVRKLAAVAIARRDRGGLMPPGFASWWHDWEGHCWQPAYASPWDGYDFGGAILHPQQPPEPHRVVSSIHAHACKPVARNASSFGRARTSVPSRNRVSHLVTRLSRHRKILSWLLSFSAEKPRFNARHLSPGRVTRSRREH